VTKCNCEHGWVEVDDMPAPCPRCSRPQEPVADYVRRLAALMGLRDWTVEVQDEPASDGTLAECDAIFGQRYARISLCSEWYTLDPAVQRSTVAHELLHCHVAQLSNLVNAMLEQTKGSKVARACWSVGEEYLVDAIAEAWAQTLPLPESVDQRDWRKRWAKTVIKSGSR
jgi:hypothetical protein